MSWIKSRDRLRGWIELNGRYNSLNVWYRLNVILDFTFLGLRTKWVCNNGTKIMKLAIPVTNNQLEKRFLTR